MTLAKELIQRGHSVVGTRRSPEGVVILESNKIPAIQLDITDPEQFKVIKGDFDWVVNCSAPSHTTVAHYTAVYYQGSANIANWLKQKRISKFVYTSSTGVYGQNDGSVVTEQSPTVPGTDTGKILVATEDLLLKMHRAYNLPVVILRVAGIYGYDRGYYFKQFINHRAQIHGDGSRYLNMVHIEDVVGTIIAALEKGVPGEIYNVVDDEPVREIDFYRWLSGELQMPMPPVVSQKEIAGTRAISSNKRVSNEKLKKELGYQFKYPTFREGYRQKVAEFLTGEKGAKQI